MWCGGVRTSKGRQKTQASIRDGTSFAVDEGMKLLFGVGV